MEKIKQLRLKVDEVDESIMNLLEQRFTLSDQILREKQRLGLRRLDAGREEAILSAARSRSEAVEKVYLELLRISKEQV